MSTQANDQRLKESAVRAADKFKAQQGDAPRRPARKAATKTGRADKADDITRVAEVLKRFIDENKLSTEVHGKTFVNVEAWQYAASLLGYVVVLDEGTVENISTDSELKYRASAGLYHIASGHRAGGGVGVCSNKETGKKFYQEFAICSMAQTRAVSKAVRVPFGYLIKAAGFEATPAEEMDYNTPPAPTAAPALPAAAPMRALPAAAAAPVDTPASEPGGWPIGLDGKPEVGGSFLTNDDREKIIRLLNHPLITRQEKTKMHLNLPRFSDAKAKAAIAKLSKAIEDREGTAAVAA